MRAVFNFHGGIHPPENKRQSVRTPIADAGIPPELILPLSQHIGAPAKPVVSIGDQVLKGQRVAEAGGEISAPLHAPSSGTIRAIEERVIAHPSGLRAPCIVIAADGRDEWIEHSATPDYRALDSASLIRLIHDAGIAGMGGAGFPTAVKLSVHPPARITTLIINGAECEPYITCDDMLMRERANQIIAGINILRHILAPEETLIGVEDNKPEALAALRAAAQGSAIEVVELRVKYPSGGEKQLIELLTGRQVPAGQLPAQIGVVCVNVGSASAVFNAVTLGRPLISRVATVTGDNVRDPQNFEVLIGTPFSYLLEKAGYQAQANDRVIMGGSMMGFAVADLAVPVVKTTNCLLAPTASELPVPPPAQACIRCGLCAEACPASLLPQQLFWFAQGREFGKLEQHHLFDCIECGACAYVCPSSIPLVQYYRASKSRILQLRDDHASADAARLRFETRNQRLQRDAVEKSAKRAARKRAAEQRARSDGGDGVADDPIRAAVERARARKAALQSAAGADSELASREHAVASARKRLETASAKLDEAAIQDSERVEALRAGVANTRAKLRAAEQALRDYQQMQHAVAPNPAVADSTGQAIDQPNPARATTQSPRDKTRAELQKLQQLLQQSQASLSRSSANGEQQKVIIALEATVARLQEKIDAITQQLQAMRDE
jgi:electron transport complex protein RnfC